MKLLVKTTAALLILLTVSCGPNRIYTTGTYGSIKSYTEKQHFVDQKTTETYISGDVSFGRHMQEDEAFDDSKTIASINLHQNSTGRFYNYYFGVGAAAGRYKFKQGYLDLINDGETQAFYSVNLKAGINYTYTRPKVDYRFIGLELTYHNEFGPYQDKLSELEDALSDIIVINQKSLFAYNIYSEYVFKIKNDEALTLGFYFGDIISTGSIKEYSRQVNYSGFTMGLRMKKYTFHVVFESGENKIRSTKLGLSYQL